VARTYEFHVQVARTISHESERSERVKSCSCRENHKIHIVELTCNGMFFLSYRHTDDGVIDDFPKISDFVSSNTEVARFLEGWGWGV